MFYKQDFGPELLGNKHCLLYLLLRKKQLQLIKMSISPVSWYYFYMSLEKEQVIRSEILKNKHGFSTRLGGVSEGIFESLNLGINRGDAKENVIKNYDIFFDACDILNHEFMCGNQVHGAYVHVADISEARPAYGEGNVVEADGFVTKCKNLPLVIFTADCVPVLLEDREAGVIGAIHCGWRSTAADIQKEAVNKMQSLGACVKNIHAAIGPAIDVCCFEVGAEVTEAMDKLIGDASSFYHEKENKKYMLDLRGVVRERFLQLGLKDENIEITGPCTMCHPELFWSHRYTGGQRGSQASVICMEE